MVHVFSCIEEQFQGIILAREKELPERIVGRFKSIF